MVKNLPASADDARDVGSILRLGRCPGGGNGMPSPPFQYSCLENFMGRGAWWVVVHGAAKNWTWLRDSMHTRDKKNQQTVHAGLVIQCPEQAPEPCLPELEIETSSLHRLLSSQPAPPLPTYLKFTFSSFHFSISGEISPRL